MIATTGAVYGNNTENRIGAIETILATSWVGIFFSLFSGMPVVRIQSNGGVKSGMRLESPPATNSCPLYGVFLRCVGYHRIDRSSVDYEYRHL